jgi:hypothetical protein
MAIGERAHRTAHHAPGRMAPQFGVRHRRRGARYSRKEQAYNRLREKERGLDFSSIKKPCNFLSLQGFDISSLKAQVALR